MIVAAAILEDGKVYSVPKPGRHHDVMAQMINEGLPPPITGEQGFLTDQGEFLGRMDAGQVALSENQIKSLQWPPELYSEDLW